MCAADQRLVEPPRGVSRAWCALAAAVVLVLIAAGFIVGRAGAGRSADAAAIADVKSIPIGVLHSRAGARAAADSYLVVDQRTIEQDPGRFATLVRDAFATTIQPAVLEQAAAVRAQDPSGMALWASGGRSATMIGAHRIDYYRDGAAQVTTWVGTIFWGPGQPPKQVWDLARTQLRWTDGRWLVTAMVTRLPTPGPVPASTPQADPSNDTAGDFDNALAGFSALGTRAPLG